MARGSVAKENVTKIIAKAFGADFVGEADKKLYVQADDGGEKVQIAISLTCPKTPLAVNDCIQTDSDYRDESTPVAKAEIPQEEIDFAKNLLKNLGIED